MDKQVEKGHYDFKKYSDKNRWVSYFHQISETLKLKPSSVLEIGVGDKVFGSYLKNNTAIEYKSMDLAEDLHPDVVGSINQIPFTDNTFDLVAAFEVLEHLPYSDFDQSIRELFRVSKKWVLISLPHFGPPMQLYFKIPFLPKIYLSFKIPYYKRHKFNGEHYWEIGKKGYPLKRITEDLEKYAVIKKDFLPFENQYHHFFILEKK